MKGEIYFDQGFSEAPLLFSGPEEIISAHHIDEVDAAFSRLDQAISQGKWVAGYAAYELGYVLEPSLRAFLSKDFKHPLMVFGVFDKAQSGATYFENSGAYEVETPLPSWNEAEYKAAFDQVLDYIIAGDIYQANLTFPLKGRVAGDPRGLYRDLKEKQPVKYGAYCDLGVGPVILSRSPELFFTTDAQGNIKTAPMKGTQPRGSNPAEDMARRLFLQSDAKNKAENLMIVDLLRNDLSRISRLGSVKVPKLFEVETYATLHQMVSVVEAELHKGWKFGELFEALFPCGSITGAPKIRAMEIIHELEPEPRGVYCGTLGWIAPDRRSSFNVAIRTLSLFETGEFTLNIGGGVVYDSTASSEYEEALWKARFLTQLNKA